MSVTVRGIIPTLPYIRRIELQPTREAAATVSSILGHKAKQLITRDIIGYRAYNSIRKPFAIAYGEPAKDVAADSLKRTSPSPIAPAPYTQGGSGVTKQRTPQPPRIIKARTFYRRRNKGDLKETVTVFLVPRRRSL